MTLFVYMLIYFSCLPPPPLRQCYVYLTHSVSPYAQNNASNHVWEPLCSHLWSGDVNISSCRLVVRAIGVSTKLLESLAQSGGCVLSRWDA